MPRFEHRLFVCTHRRDGTDSRGSCAERGSQELLVKLQKLRDEHKLKGKVRITASGCLDYCVKGCSAVAFSSGSSDDTQQAETWYTHLTSDDANELFEKHILRGEIWADKKEGR